jgi:hypothetical protein
MHFSCVKSSSSSFPKTEAAAKMRRWLLAIALAGCVCSCMACPPQGFDSMVDLDVNKFLQGTWYSQQQVRGIASAHGYLTTSITS